MGIEEQEKLDQFTKKIMSESGLESPSYGFEQRLMSKIEASKPTRRSSDWLISIKVWGIFAFGIAVLTAILFTINIDSSEGWSGAFSKQINLPNYYAEITSSGIFIYSILLFTLMVAISTLILKRYLDKHVQTP